MLTAIEVENLRGIKHAKLSGITPITVIVGPNNAGKSTILDAIWLGASPDPQRALDAVLKRRLVAKPTKWLLRLGKLGEANDATIKARTGEGVVRNVRIVPRDDIPNNLAIGWGIEGADQKRNKLYMTIGGTNMYHSGPLEGVPEVKIVDPKAESRASSLSELYTVVVEKGLRRDATAIVRELVPAIEEVQILTQDQKPVLYMVFGQGAHPVELAGDGIQLLMRLSFELVTASGGIVLLEEPETHLHPGAIRQCARAIVAAYRRGVQIILSTHSLDMIDALLFETREKDWQSLSIHRVLLSGGEMKIHTFSGEEASLARTQVEDDLR